MAGRPAVGSGEIWLVPNLLSTRSLQTSTEPSCLVQGWVQASLPLPWLRSLWLDGPRRKVASRRLSRTTQIGPLATSCAHPVHPTLWRSLNNVVESPPRGARKKTKNTTTATKTVVMPGMTKTKTGMTKTKMKMAMSPEPALRRSERPAVAARNLLQVSRSNSACLRCQDWATTSPFLLSLQTRRRTSQLCWRGPTVRRAPPRRMGTQAPGVMTAMAHWQAKPTRDMRRRVAATSEAASATRLKLSARSRCWVGWSCLVCQQPSDAPLLHSHPPTFPPTAKKSPWIPGSHELTQCAYEYLGLAIVANGKSAAANFLLVGRNELAVSTLLPAEHWLPGTISFSCTASSVGL